VPTRNVVITEHQAELIERLVAAGRYQNASEVLRDGLRLVERRENEDETKLRLLREAAREGIADIRAGRFYTFERPIDTGRHVAALTKEVLAARRVRRRRR
jgi:antitoxin ParD1/3/4